MRGVVVGVFALVWTSLVLVADGMVAAGGWQAYQSSHWPTVPGTVTDSRLETGRKSVSLLLRYTYAVDGKDQTGTRYDLGPAFLPAQKWPKVVAEVPAGSSVTVYYDPADPATAVLSPGLRADILPTALGLLPFNVAAVILGGMAWRAMNPRRRFDPARDVRPVPAGVAVRLNGFSRLAVFGFALLAVSFAGVFLVAVLLHSVWQVPATWPLDGAILAGTVVLSGLIAARWGGPRYLVEGADEFTVPTTPTGRATSALPRAAVKHVEVLAETRRGNKGRTYTVHVVSLVAVVGGERCTIRFAEYRAPADARALADWVLERIGQKPRG